MKQRLFAGPLPLWQAFANLMTDAGREPPGSVPTVNRLALAAGRVVGRYQILGTGRRPFRDSQVVMEALREATP